MSDSDEYSGPGAKVKNGVLCEKGLRRGLEGENDLEERMGLFRVTRNGLHLKGTWRRAEKESESGKGLADEE